MHTQRAVRRFKPDAVPPEAVSRVLAAATRAPSGGNSQPWSFVVLRDAGVRRQVGALYKDAWDAGGVDRLTSDPDPAKARVYKSAKYLAERMGEAPVLILACIESGGRGPSLTTGASIYPAVQNLMLAARALGLGTVITTIHRGREREIKELAFHPRGRDDGGPHPHGLPGRGRRIRAGQAQADFRSRVRRPLGTDPGHLSFVHFDGRRRPQVTVQSSWYFGRSPPCQAESSHLNLPSKWRPLNNLPMRAHPMHGRHAFIAAPPTPGFRLSPE